MFVWFRFIALLVANVVATVRVVSNEIEQLRMYLESSPVNETGLLYLLDRCAVGKGLYPFSCGHKTAIHKLEEQSMVNITQDISCSYETSEVFGLTEERFSSCSGEIAGFDYYNVTITQKKCKAKPAIKGGASFDVMCYRGEGRGMGYVIDHFDGIYTVQCRVPRLLKAVGGCNPHSSVATTNCTPGIDIKLDYEYFRAYHDAAGHLPRQYNVHSVISTCNLSTSNYTIGAPSIRSSLQPNSFAAVQLASNTSILMTINPPVAGWVQYSNFTDSIWTSVNASRLGFLSRQSMLDIIRKYDIDMIGESHMRYTWDLLVQMYAHEDHLSQLSRKHANSDVMGIHFRDVSYYWMVARELRNISCLSNKTNIGNSRGRKHIFVLQSGTWDLGFAPGRYAVRGSMGARSMLDAVAERLRRTDCVKDARFIIVGTALYPNCDLLGSDNGKCARMRYFRSNPTIRAVNQWMLWYTRTQLGLSEKLVKFIDTSEIISPRLYTKERVCSTHFLCHKNGNIVETTPPGRAVLSEILRAMREIAEEDFSSAGSYGTGFPGNRSPSIGRYRNIGDFDGKIAKVANGTDWRYFLVENGCRREIDSYTANFFSSSIKVMTVQDTADILMVYDTPLLAESSISWADKTLYRIDASREIFAMGGNKRHSVKNMGVAMARGLDLEKVRIIQDVDMNLIPLGDPYNS
jgi:hypothetical protein